MLLIQMGKGPKLALLVAVSLTFLFAVHLSRSPSLPTWRLPTSQNAAEIAAVVPEAPPVQQQGFVESGQDEAYNAQKASQEAWSHYDPNNPSSPDSLSRKPKLSHDAARPKADPLPCESISGGDDVLVVMRTGATEIKDKLTVHLNTTFKCYDNLVIFSDFEEEFHGHQVHDVLKYIPDDIKTTNADFQHYQHVLQVGRQGLDEAELSGGVSEESGPVGKNDNAGWRLDKWKFLPMANQTLAMHPDKKFYVFVEPDTYLVWSNLLQWIPKLDANKALYYGSEVMIGDDVFAHGGSAFVLTKPALEQLALAYNARTEELHQYTAGHWAGDCVLGKTLHDMGTELSWGFPQFQGGNPSFSLNWLDTKGPRRLWCTPAVSYHHFVPYEIEDFWHFEQRWIEEQQRNSNIKKRGLPFSLWPKELSTVLFHRDTFKRYALPNMTSERKNWDNSPDWLYPDTVGIKMSECQKICQANSTCKAYSTSASGCSIGTEPRFGQKKTGVTSGWMTQRIEKWVKTMEHCGRDRWVT